MAAEESVEIMDVDQKLEENSFSGSALLIVVCEPHTEDDKELILEKLTKGLQSWDPISSGLDINEELIRIAEAASNGTEGANGEKIIQHHYENLHVDILVNPEIQTFQSHVRNLLKKNLTYRHIVFAGYAFKGSGSWVFQDDKLAFRQFASIFNEEEISNVIHDQKDKILAISAFNEGDWSPSNFAKHKFGKILEVRLNPGTKLESITGVLQFAAYMSYFVNAVPVKTLLKSSDVVGNIRFCRPTLYIFPGSQGDSALFGISGFNLLINGGYGRRSCFWDFTRHLDRIDAILLSHIGEDNLFGASALFDRKVQSNIHPELGFVYCNGLDEKQKQNGESHVEESYSSKTPSLTIDLIQDGNEMIDNMKWLGRTPHPCVGKNLGTQLQPINLYHKVGQGSLDMYVLNPLQDNKDLKEFLSQWSKQSGSFSTKNGIPLPHLLSVAVLLVWKPSQPSDKITRILLPGSTPQAKLFDGLDKLKTVDIFKHPQYSEESIKTTAAAKTKRGSTTSANKSALPPKAPTSTPFSRNAKKEKDVPETKTDSPRASAKNRPIAAKPNASKAASPVPSKTTAKKIDKKTDTKNGSASPSKSSSSIKTPLSSTPSKTARHAVNPTPAAEINAGDVSIIENKQPIEEISPQLKMETEDVLQSTVEPEPLISLESNETPEKNVFHSQSPLSNTTDVQSGMTETPITEVKLSESLPKCDSDLVVKEDVQSSVEAEQLPENNQQMQAEQIDSKKNQETVDLIGEPNNLPEPVQFDPNGTAANESKYLEQAEKESNNLQQEKVDEVEEKVVVQENTEEAVDDNKAVESVVAPLIEASLPDEPMYLNEEQLISPQIPVISPEEVGVEIGAGDVDLLAAANCENLLQEKNLEKDTDVGIEQSPFGGMTPEGLPSPKHSETEMCLNAFAEEIGDKPIDKANLIEKEVFDQPENLLEMPSNARNDDTELSIAPVEKNKEGESEVIKDELHQFTTNVQPREPIESTTSEGSIPFAVETPPGNASILNSEKEVFENLAQQEKIQDDGNFMSDFNEMEKQINEEQNISPVSQQKSSEEKDSSEKNPQEFDPLKEWGEPMALPSPAPTSNKNEGKSKAGVPKVASSRAAKDATNKSTARGNSAASRTTSNKDEPKKPTSSATRLGMTKKPTSAPLNRSMASKENGSKLDGSMYSGKKAAPKAAKDEVNKANMASSSTSKRTSMGGRKLASTSVHSTSMQKDKDEAAKSEHKTTSRTRTLRTSAAPAGSKSEAPPVKLLPVIAFYVDLAYIPHHGDSNYMNINFFRRVRARYYVYSALQPDPNVLDSLITAKQTWDDPALETTLVPTYDTDALRLWMSQNREKLIGLKVDIAPSANRCTIQLQDHETSCAAYRLEF